jgi:hypothetical protein
MEADFNCPLCGIYKMCNTSGRFALASQMEQHTGKSETLPNRGTRGVALVTGVDAKDF